MSELISKKALDKIVIDAGAKNSAMDYCTWTEYQFKGFIRDALYMAINSIDRKTLAAALSKEE